MRQTSFALTLHLVLATASSSAFMFNGGLQQRATLKGELLQLSKETERGLKANSEDQSRVLELFEKLEKLNPTKQPLRSDKVNGDWSLQYTTSDSILGKGGFPREGPILQMIDTTTLRAENSEVVNYFGIFKLPRKVSAELSPRNGQITDVQFKRFSLGPIGFDAPESFKGYLDVTYVDDDFRLSRGDKGNIFVLTRL